MNVLRDFHKYQTRKRGLLLLGEVAKAQTRRNLLSSILSMKTECQKRDGWMTCDFTCFLTIFQSYQDDVCMIMKGCVQGNSVDS